MSSLCEGRVGITGGACAELLLLSPTMGKGLEITMGVEMNMESDFLQEQIVRGQEEWF